MCLACLEAELWHAYQEEMTARQRDAAAAPVDAGRPAPPKAGPDRPAATFACEEPLPR